MLSREGFTVKLVEVVDNNDIDREVSQFKPDICIIEALWVVPSKFAVLQKLHPKVTWVVRIHSEAAFLAQEGIAIEWISQYVTYSNVYVALNSIEAFHEIMTFLPRKGLPTGKLCYLPTYYWANDKPYYIKKFGGTTVNIACMGAIRLLKNQLIQAEAAMRFADNKGWMLRFHINGGVWDMEGNAPYRNIVNLFQGTKHVLIQHDWMSHRDFIEFLGGIDMGLQVSFSETFCIVAADFVACGVPTVGSPAIRWMDRDSKADPISINDIVEHLEKAFPSTWNNLPKKNLANLRADSASAHGAWMSTLAHLLG